MQLKAKKRFGQNFLIDESIKDKIIQAIPNLESAQVIEIGPGLGDLTKRLLEKYSVTAYEVDTDLQRHLKTAFKSEIENEKLILNEGDVLEFWDEKKSLGNSPYWLISNIPYNITTPIIEKALGDNFCEAMVIMIQKEVALKLVAKHATSDFSYLSILTQIVGEAKILFDVPPTSFNPEPKVTSSVVCIRKNHKSKDIDFIKLKKYLKKSFASPRKTLQKNLLNGFDKEVVLSALSELELDKNLRPHQLCVDNHFRLFNIIN